MKATLLIFRTVLSMICLVVLAQGCVPYPYNGTGPGDQYSESERDIGILETSGPNVLVNGRKGIYGESIRGGMTVRTGKSSSARIR